MDVARGLKEQHCPQRCLTLEEMEAPPGVSVAIPERLGRHQNGPCTDSSWFGFAMSWPESLLLQNHLDCSFFLASRSLIIASNSSSISFHSLFIFTTVFTLACGVVIRESVEVIVRAVRLVTSTVFPFTTDISDFFSVPLHNCL